MRKVLLLSFAIAALPLVSHAEQVKIAGTHSEEEIQSACKNVSGDFESNTNGTYSCTKNNCDGKGVSAP